MVRVFWVLVVGIMTAFQMEAATFDKKSFKEGVIPFKDITFFLQPYEEAGTACKFTKLEASHDYVVYCGPHEFSVHFFARPYRQPTQEAFEILMMVSEISNRQSTESATVSVWVMNSKGSEMQNILVSLGVFKNTASLDVRVAL